MYSLSKNCGNASELSGKRLLPKQAAVRGKSITLGWKVQSVRFSSKFRSHSKVKGTVTIVTASLSQNQVSFEHMSDRVALIPSFNSSTLFTQEDLTLYASEDIQLP